MNHRNRRGIVFATISAIAASGLAAMVATPAEAAVSCSVAYAPNYWGGGFTVGIKVTNSGDALNGWTLRFTWGGDQRITNGWNGVWAQSGSQVTVTNASWNGTVASGGVLDIGGQGTWTSNQSAPTGYSVNNVACGSGGGGTTTTTTTRAATTTTTRAGVTTTTTRAGVTTTTTRAGVTTTTTGGGSTGTHADNPYVGTGYNNPEWKAKAESVSGGSRVSSQPTAVWLDRIAAIEGTDNSSSNGSMGLRDHLDAALAQGAAYIQVVIYDLPGRDCAALASNGELGATEIDRYRNEYIDPIAAIEHDSKYASLRIINIIEIDSLPNLITNTGSRATATAACDTMKANGNYEIGIGYAIQELRKVTNTYAYIDGAHHGWIGWDDNFGASIDLFASTASRASGGGKALVDGFIVNTANYSALSEPYITVDSTTRQSKWIDWNMYNDESTFATAFRSRAVSAGFPSNIGMLIDTSRNGWGGSARPTAASTLSDLNARIDASRIDRRIHKGNWCNQSGAGLGERPRANPASGIDAYVWVKPPGESDGSSTLIDNDEGKGFDQMCDPTYAGNARNGNSMTGSLSGAPISGAWFAAQFTQLMANAYPPLG